MSVEKKIPKIEIKIASPERIRELSSGGEVKKYETYDSNRMPIDDGLFDYKIFCNQKICPEVNKLNCFTILNTNNSCAGCKEDNCRGCENQKSHHDLFKQYQKLANECCKKCLTKKNKCSYERMGHIELAAPVVHIWFKDTICKILGFTKKEFNGILEFQKYIDESDVKFVLDKKNCISKDGKDGNISVEEYKKEHESCHLISGANVIRLLLLSLDENYEAEIEHLKEIIKESKGETKKALESRLELIEEIHNSGNKFSWMVLAVLPVVPPSIRPEVKTGSSDKDFSKDDLNNLYTSVISRNERIKNLDKMSAPKVMIGKETRLLQKAVDALFDNAKCKGYQKRVYKGENSLTKGRVYKSLTDRISKKEGLFRQNLLGKRVDFSGRSVIVPGPELQLWQCGLPYDMAFELFRFQIIHEFAVQILDNLDQIIYGCDINIFRYDILKRFRDKIPDEVFCSVEDSIRKTVRKEKKAEEKNNIKSAIKVADLENKNSIDEIITIIKEELSHDDLSDLFYKIGLINYRTNGSVKTKLKNAKKYELKKVFKSLTKIINSLNKVVITNKLLEDDSLKKTLSEFKEYEETKIESISNINEKAFFEGLLKEIINHNSLHCTCKLPQTKDEFQIFYMEKHLNSILRNCLSRYKKYGFEEREKILFKDLLWRILLEFQSNLKEVTDYPGATAKLLKDSSFMRTLSNLKEIEEKAIECLSDISDENFFKNLLKEIIVYDSVGKFCVLSDSKTAFEDYMEKHMYSILRNCLSVYKKNKLEEQDETLFKDLLWNIIIELRSNFNLYSLVEKVVKDYPVLLNRQPSLHRLNIQAFEPVIVEEKAIKLHPLLCKSFGADFDGDQMAVHIPIGKEAIKECKELLLSTKNMFKPGDGKPIFVPSQDMVLGLYLLSAIDENEECSDIFLEENESKRKYDDSRFWDWLIKESENLMDKVQIALKCGKVGLNTPIKLQAPKNSFDLALLKSENKKKEERYIKSRTQVFKKGDKIKTTAGLYMLNSSLPAKVPYINRQLDADIIKKLIDAVYELTNPEVTIELHDTLKQLGFEYATRFGASISISMDEIDISEKIKGKKNKNNEKGEINPNKQWKKLTKKIGKLAYSKTKGLITRYEYNKRIEKLFIENNKNLEDKMKDLLESKRTAPGVFDMADSGARGKWNQVSQIALMKGLVKNSRGDANLILSNFYEGLNPHEYFISTAGTRRDLFDGKFSTGDAGYITRRLVYAAQNVVITKEDCGCDIPDDERSILTCKCDTGICQKCYENDLSFGRNRKNLVEIGTPVGIIAAQSLGEPTSQLVLDSKHKYGVSNAEENKNEKNNQIISECAGKVEIYALGDNDEKVDLKVLLDENNTLVFKEKYSDLCPKVKVGEEIFDIPYGYILCVRDGEEIKEATVIAENPKTVEVLTKIERLLENWTTDCAVVSDVSGKIDKIELATNNQKKEFYDFVIEQEIQTKDGKKYRIERPYSIPVSEKLLVKDGDKVTNGQLLCKENKDSIITAESTGTVKIEYDAYKLFTLINEDKNSSEKIVKKYQISSDDIKTVLVNKNDKIKKDQILFEKNFQYKASDSGIVESIVKTKDEKYIVIEIIKNSTKEIVKYKLLNDGTKKILVEEKQNIQKGQILWEGYIQYKSPFSGIIDIEDVEKSKFISIVDDNGKESKCDIANFILKVKDGDKVNAGDLLCYSSIDYPTRAKLYIPKVSKKEEDISGTVKFLTEKSENWNVVVEDKDKDGKKHIFSVPRSSQLCVEVGKNVEKGTPLNKGNISYNDRLLVKKNKLEVQNELVDELHNLIKDVDKKHIEVIVRQMFKDVNDDGTGSIKGITKLGLESDSFLVASAFQRTSTGLVNAALKGKEEQFTGIIENQMIGNLIPAGMGSKKSEQNKNDE